MATIGRLRVAIEANGAKLSKGLKSAQARFGKFTSNVIKYGKRITGAFALAGAAIAGGLILAINKNAEAIDKVTKMAGKFEMPVEDFQQLQYVASLSNVEMENFGKSMQRMMKTVGDARDGLSTATGAFEQLNLSADQLAMMGPAQQFAAISKQMGTLPTQADRIKVAMDIFGRSGADLLNVFKGDIDSLIAEFDRMGITITQQQANNVAAFQDAKNRLGTMFTGFSRVVTAELAPVFTDMITKISDTIEEMGGLRSAANKFAKFIVSAMQTAFKVIEGVSKAILSLRESMAKFKIFSTTLGEIVAENFSPEKWGGLLKGTAKNLLIPGKLLFDPPKLRMPDPELSQVPDLAKDLIDLQNGNADVRKMFESAGKKLEEAGSKVGEMVDREADARDKNNAAIDGNTNSMGALTMSAKKSAEMLEKVTKSKAWQDIFGKADVTSRSAEFDKYARLVKSGIESGSGFTGSNLNTLKQIIQTAQNNQGMVFSNQGKFERVDVEGMSEVVRGLEAMMGRQPAEAQAQTIEITRQNKENTTGVLDNTTNIKGLMERALEIAQRQPEKIGELNLNMITDTGKIAGKIWGEPEFLYRLKAFHEQQTNDAARASAGG